MKPYPVFVQASGEEMVRWARNLDELERKAPALSEAAEHPTVSEVIIAASESDQYTRIDAAIALEKLGYLVFSYFGDSYDVCDRMLRAHHNWRQEEDIIVRILPSWRNICWEYVDQLVETLRLLKGDGIQAVFPAKDFDYTMAADVCTTDILVRAQEVLDSSAQASANPLYDRARFCPWAWFEASDWPNTFALNNSPSYGPETVHKILEKSRSYPEHEAVGTGYRGTSYHWIAWALLSPEDRMLSLAYRLPLANMRVLDVACGYGLGSFHLADIFGEVVGIDYDPETVAAARRQFPRSNLHYHQGNIQDPYSLGRAEEFDFVISLHTLEHVDDDREALSNLYRVLKPRGTMVIEVPIQAKHPLGRPINPHHKREYEAEQITKMITETGLRIKDVWGGCRAIYTPGLGKMRDSILIWTEKA